jgi:N,N'-diacetyllegionaminate synthase
MREITIDGRVLRSGQKPWVIAEMGVNHDGSLQRAMEIVAIAAACGADAVKLQIFRANTLMHVSANFAGYQKKNVDAETPVEMLRKYELSSDEIRRIVQRIRELKMTPLATPFSPGDVETIESLRLPAIKIASPDLVNLPLLELAARTGKPLLVSTGAATMEEVEAAVGWLRKWHSQFALLHCVSAYPTPGEQANLCWIEELSRRFDCPVGYSDHTSSYITGALSVALGASILEKHLTFDRGARGPDHAASADERQFERYVKLAREAQPFRGEPGKHVLDIEQDVREVSRQSLVLRRSIFAGNTLKADDLTVQRPGTGLPAAQITQAVGRRIARHATAGSMLEWDMLDAA